MSPQDSPSYMTECSKGVGADYFFSKSYRIASPCLRGPDRVKRLFLNRFQWPRPVRADRAAKPGGERLPKGELDCIRQEEVDGSWVTNSRCPAKLYFIIFKVLFMEMVSFDFTTILWEYVCQLLLFPCSDENTRAQIT